jgi:hypothetical protein
LNSCTLTGIISPSPLDIALELHDLINEKKLVGNIGVIHFKNVLIQQIPPQEGEVDVLLEGCAPNPLGDSCPGDALAFVQDHEKGFWP